MFENNNNKCTEEKDSKAKENRVEKKNAKEAKREEFRESFNRRNSSIRQTRGKGESIFTTRAA